MVGEKKIAKLCSLNTIAQNPLRLLYNCIEQKPMSINSKRFIIFFLFYTLARSKYVKHTKAELVTAVHVVRRLSGSVHAA